MTQGAATSWGQTPAPAWQHQAAGYSAASFPGIIPLRPLSLSDLYEGAMRAIRTNPKATFGVSLLIMAITGGLSVLIQLGASALVAHQGWTDSAFDAESGAPEFGFGASNEQIGQNSMAQNLGAFGSLPLTLLATYLLTAALITVVGQAVLGRQVSLSDCIQEIRKNFWRWLGVSFLQALIVGVVFFLAMLPFLLTARVELPGLFTGELDPETGGIDGIGAVLVVGFFTLPITFALMAWIWTKTLFILPSYVLEQNTALGAVRRAFALSKGHFWRILGISLLTSILVGIVAAIVSTPVVIVQMIVLLVSETAFAAALGSALAIFLSNLIQAMFLPFQVIVTSLLYLDVRMRKEGLDVVLMQQAANDADGQG